MPQGEPRPGEFYLHFKQKLYQITAVAKHSETGEWMVVYQALYGTFQTYVQPLERFIGPVDRGKYPDVRQKYRFQLAELKVVEKPQMKQNQTISENAIPKQMISEKEVSKQPKMAAPTQQVLPEQPKTPTAAQQASSAQKTAEQPKMAASTQQASSAQKTAEQPKMAASTQQASSAQKTAEQPKMAASTRQISPEQTARRRAGGVSHQQEEKMMAFFEAETMQEKYQILLEMQNDVTDRMINNMAVALDVVIEEGPLDLRYEDLKACVRTFQRYEVNESRMR